MENIIALLEGIAYRQQILAPGDTLFHQGAAAERLYVVRRGRLRLLRHAETGQLAVLRVAGPGDLLAEAALGGSHFHCDAVAESTAEVLGYERRGVEARLREDPRAALAWIVLQAREIQRLRTLLALTRLRGARARVLGYLRLLADPRGVVELAGSLRELAEEIGLSPEAFYRTLGALERDGRLRREGRRVALLEHPGADPP